MGDQRSPAPPPSRPRRRRQSRTRDTTPGAVPCAAVATIPRRRSCRASSCHTGWRRTATTAFSPTHHEGSFACSATDAVSPRAHRRNWGIAHQASRQHTGRRRCIRTSRFVRPHSPEGDLERSTHSPDATPTFRHDRRVRGRDQPGITSRRRPELTRCFTDGGVDGSRTPVTLVPIV